MPSLGERVANNEKILTTNMIGEAAVDLKNDPASWKDRGELSDVLQELKLLWHVLVTCAYSSKGYNEK